MTAVETRKPDEVLEPGEPTMAELAERITSHHNAAAEHVTRAVTDWIAVGEALIIARSRCEPGGWWKWVADNTPLAAHTVSVYVRIARYRDIVESHPEPLTNIKQAKRILAWLPNAGSREYAPADPDQVERAKQLRAEGLTYAAIGEVFGVSKTTASAWLNPGAAQKLTERSERNKKRRREAARALAAKEREQATKQALAAARGKAKAEAYTMVNRLDGLMGQAREEAKTQEERRELNEAHKYRDKMMEHLVRALGVS